MRYELCMNFLHFIVPFVQSYAKKKIINPVFTGSEAAVLFYSFGLRALFCASHFTTKIREFGELNSTFSVSVFTGSARDALRTVLSRQVVGYRE
jgi:uncharacterized membrane protein